MVLLLLLLLAQWVHVPQKVARKRSQSSSSSSPKSRPPPRWTIDGPLFSPILFISFPSSCLFSLFCLFLLGEVVLWCESFDSAWRWAGFENGSQQKVNITREEKRARAKESKETQNQNKVFIKFNGSCLWLFVIALHQSGLSKYICSWWVALWINLPSPAEKRCDEAIRCSLPCVGVRFNVL